MSHDDAFMQAILENPDDDTPRLIYADWLDDHEDPARAEFIRLQCRINDLPFEDSSLPDLLGRESQLLNDHVDQWLGDIRPKLRRWTFHRGFLEELVLSVETYLALWTHWYGIQLTRPSTVRRIAVDLARDGRTRLARFDRAAAQRQFRVRFYAETDDSVIRNIGCGILFVDAAWSGSSRAAFSRLCDTLRETDPNALLELVVADIDGLRPSTEFRRVNRGAGETFWIRDGQVVHYSSCPLADGFEQPTRLLLQDLRR
jgi:uncharacterized protein (TIGR02996 family)